MYQWLYNKELYFVKDNKDDIPKDIREYDEEILGGKFLGHIIRPYDECYSSYSFPAFEYYVLYLEMYRKYYIMRKVNFNHNIKKTIMKKCILKMIRVNCYSGCPEENILVNDYLGNYCIDENNLEEENDIVMYRTMRKDYIDENYIRLPDISVDDIYRIVEKNII